MSIISAKEIQYAISSKTTHSANEEEIRFAIEWFANEIEGIMAK
ncbi:hypothetical protein ACFPES_17540 [Paenibacillus sp. GCM10023248]|nr:hypothetical protein [Paenibacillus sp. MAHUQ-63]